MQTSKELKQSARKVLENKWGDAVMATLTCIIFSLGLYFALTRPFEGNDARESLAQLVTTLLLLPLDWGLLLIFLRLFRQEEGTETKNLFEGYQQFSRICGTQILRQIYTALWSLLFFIPGVVKSLSYSMTPYILADNPELKYNGAIERSMKMMKGHKWHLFCLSLSFIWWGILAICTLGIGFLWLTPYYNVTMAAFYEDLKKENCEMPTEEPAIAEQ